MLLGQLLHSLEYIVLQGSTGIEINGISDHSAKVKPGDLFVCIKGYHTDSHHYLPEIFAGGASCIVVERLSDQLETLMERYTNTAILLVKNTMKALALLASAYYGDPAKRLTMIGITGTKGKTTTACMLNAILCQAGIKSGMIGTLGAWYEEELETPVTTTPDALTLHRLLAEMERRGCTHVVLEVSSQSLMCRRVYGIPFKLAVFTNLSPDHIGEGEHSSLEEYRYWKSTLFAHAEISVINRDADGAGMMAGMALGQVIYYEYSNIDQREARQSEVEVITRKSFGQPEWKAIAQQISLPGSYNRENALAAMTAADALGIPAVAYTALETLQIPGRSELLSGDGYQVIIDYAHNESSMENLLRTLREMNPKRLICIYGSGGNRSILRRQGMGRVGGLMADLSVLTEDNSRTEPLKQILEGLVAGVQSVQGKYMVIPDRKEAIHRIIGSAEDGDLIAIIGKGHETYQEIGTERVYFNDKEEACLAMKRRGAAV